MEKFTIRLLPSKEIAPGVSIREAHLNQVMVTFVLLKKDSAVPPHRHPHEQISLVVEGRLQFTVEGKTAVLEAGEGIRVPSSAEHSAKPLDGDVWAYDCFSPIRENYIID